MATHDGVILLNYVAPAARWRGVSKLLLNRMESDLLALGCDLSRLESSVTARMFYRAEGYVDDDSGQPGWMTKRLAGQGASIG